MKSLVVLAICSAMTTALAAQGKPRARDLGIPFEGTPGALDAITDVSGIEVGMSTLISGETVRTGVTAILPRGKSSSDPVFAGWFSLNGNGEMTGTTWIEEAGFLEGPIFITNTHSVGTVRDASIQWAAQRGTLFQPWALPVVAETYDGGLNDINGFHVKPEHVFAALDGAKSGAVPEGNVGAEIGNTSPPSGREDDQASKSIIIVVATDAPLLPHQLKRLARRASLGLARTGSISGNGSGDIFIAFSTANPGAASAPDTSQVSMLSNQRITALFEAAVQATEEAIINALIAAETMTGINGTTSSAIPHEQVRDILRKYGRL